MEQSAIQQDPPRQTTGDQERLIHCGSFPKSAAHALLVELITTAALFLLPHLCMASLSCIAIPATQEIRLTGFTRARATLDIISETSGTCLHIYADTGESINADGKFAQLDTTLVRLDLDALRVEQAQVRRTLRFDELQVERFGQLLSTRVSSRSRLDELEVHRDKTALQVDLLKIKEKRLQELLRRHTVKAPAGWRLIKRMVEEGQWVSRGAILGRAGDYRTLVVPLALTHEQLQALQATPALDVLLPDLQLRGQAVIHRVSPAFDPVTRKIAVEIRLQPELMARLPERRGGLRVEIPLALADPLHSFLVPAGAVEERYEQHWLTRENGEKIQVTVLGPGKKPGEEDTPWLRVVAPEIHPGDSFLIPASR